MGKEFVSFPTLSEAVKAHTILVNRASKTYAMTGWRIGFAAASREIIQVMNNYLSHSLSGTCSIAQAAAGGLRRPQEEIEAMRQAFETRRNYLYDRMSQIPGVHPVRSEATFYMLMNLSQLIGKTLYGVEIHDADDFANVFLKEGPGGGGALHGLWGRPTMSGGPSPCPWRTSRRAWTGWRSS